MDQSASPLLAETLRNSSDRSNMSASATAVLCYLSFCDMKCLRHVFELSPVRLEACAHLSVELCPSCLATLDLLSISVEEVQPLSLELPLESDDRGLSFLQNCAKKKKTEDCGLAACV